MGGNADDDKLRPPGADAPPAPGAPVTPAGDKPPKVVAVRSSIKPPGSLRSLLGTTISDRYRIERLLGEGGMGAVYQAEHTLMRKRMAIKVLHPEMTRLPEVVARFEREALAAAHIDHPHVVTATDFGKLPDGAFFLALEFVEGASLRAVIGAGRLELGRALHIARQMASALQRAHALKIVHRDLKPENVMLVERDGDPDFVKVLDFGIAKVQMGELGTNDRAGPEQSVLTQAGMVYGTPEYMAPEQALGQPVDARADLYALGVIMFEMLTGHRPFEADSKVALLGMQVTAPVPAMATKCADCDVPPEVEALVGRMLAKEAAERVADAKEVIDGISAVLAQLSGTGRVDARFLPPPPSAFATNPGLLSAPALSIGSSSSGGAAPDREPPGTSGASGASGAEGPGAPASAAPLGGRAWIVAMAAGILGLLVLVTAVVSVLRSTSGATRGDDAAAGLVGRDDAATPDAPARAELPMDDKVREAIAMIERGDYDSGMRRLDELGDAPLGREDVHRARMTAYVATDRMLDAMREAGLVLKVNPNLDLTKEVKLRVEIRDLALKEGGRDAAQKPAVDEAFALLSGTMGTIGWDDLYDVAYGVAGTQYPKAAARARTELSRGDHAKMSPALQVTLDLQADGVSCAARAHFERAAKDGDERTLAVLRPLTGAHAMRSVGFKKIDQLGCLHSDGALARAIADIEAHVRAQKRN